MINDSTNTHAVITEDEIDLKELFSTLWKNKFIIIIITALFTLFGLLYALSKPNEYRSSTVLVPQNDPKPSLAGFGNLAALAGVSPKSGQASAIDSLQAILNDFEFNKYVIQKYSLINKLKTNPNNLVFAFGYDGIYNLFNSENNTLEKEKDEEELLYDAYKIIQKILSLDSDKNSGLITLSAQHADRFLVKDLIEIYLAELTQHLRMREMADVEQQIKYYQQELNNTNDIKLKEELSKLASVLVQKRVLSQSNPYYNVSQLTTPHVPYIKDKTGPKRALILVVSFVTGFILSVFFVFLYEFVRNSEVENSSKN